MYPTLPYQQPVAPFVPPAPPQLPYYNPLSQGVSNPTLATNHIYQALQALSNQQLGGQSAQAQVQQAAQNSQKAGPGGFGGAVGGGVTGAIIGGTLGGPLAPLTALFGGLLGAGLGAFTPIMQTPQNAAIKAIQDIQNGQEGNIVPDIGRQLTAQQSAPNYNQVLGKLNPFPNASPFGNTFLLGGLTNPHNLANIGLNVATNPYTFIPGAGSSDLARLGSEDIANAGIEDAVKGVNGSVNNAFLSKAGGNLRNEIAQKLGSPTFAELPEELSPQFNEAFGQAVNANPSAYINNVGMKLPLVPFTHVGVPIASAKAVNAIAESPMVSGLNDLLKTATSPLTQLLGKSVGQQQVAKEFGDEGLAGTLGAISSSKSVEGEEQSQVLNALHTLLSQNTPEDIIKATNAVEHADPSLANPDTISQLQALRDSYSQYVAKNNPELVANAGESFLPKTPSLNEVGSLNPFEAALQKTFGTTPLMDKNVASPSFLPGMTANSAKETILGKFVNASDKPIGENGIGDPNALGIQRVERYTAPKEVDGISGKVIGEGTDKYGNTVYEKYLPRDEANASYAKANNGRLLYESNGAISIAQGMMDASRKAAYNNTVDRLLALRVRDATGAMSPLIKDATISPFTGKAVKSEIDPALEQLGKGQFNGKIVPRSINNLLKEQFAPQTGKSTNDLLKLLNGAGNISRRLELLNPLFHQTHNLLFNSLLAGQSPLESAKNILSGLKPGFTEKLMQDPYVQQYIKAGGEVNGLKGALKQGESVIDQLRNTFPDDSLKTKAGGLLDRFNQWNVDAVQSAELAQRRDIFKGYLDKGFDATQAREATENVMFRYGGMSDFEKNYVSNLFPFYQWMKNNTALWAKHPSELGAMQSILNGVNENTSGHQMALNPQNEQNKVYLGKIGGNDAYINPTLPFKDIQAFSQNPLSFLEDRVNPAISTTAHLATNTDAFGNQIDNPNLPTSLQSKSMFGLNLDPRLAYALTNALPPAQGLASPQKAFNPTALLANGIGSPVSQVNPNTQTLQEYEAQKATVNALAALEQKKGNLTYQQATPYNTSPKTDQYITTLQNRLNTMSDTNYGYHYENGQKVMATGTNATKYQSHKAKSHSSSTLRSAKRAASKIHLPKPKQIHLRKFT